MNLKLPRPCTTARMLSILDWLDENRGRCALYLTVRRPDEEDSRYCYAASQMRERLMRTRNHLNLASWDAVVHWDVDVEFETDELGMEFFLRFT